MANNFAHSHLCPVCWQSWVHGQRIYCTNECRRTASNFLNRTFFVRSNLAELGFTFIKADGIFFDIEIPGELKPYYPTFNHRFSFPCPGLHIDALSGEALLNVVGEFLGKQVVSLIRECLDENYSSAPRTREWFHKRVLSLYNHPAWSTFCPKCCVKRISTEAGWDPQNDCCTDCSIIAIPF